MVIEIHRAIGRRLARERGVTIVESLFVIGLVAVVSSLAMGLTAEWRALTRSVGAARLLVTQVRLARAVAVREAAPTGILFRQDAGEFVLRLYQDGNGNGIRQADIDRGIDAPVGALIRLRDYFAGTALRVPIPLPPIEDGTGVAAGSSPVRLSGGSTILGCSPTGSTTSGSLYVAGPRGEVFAVRLLGTTGRLRLFEYVASSTSWREL